MEQSKRGGARPGSGRKSTGEKKKPVTIYVEHSKIWKFGSEDKMKLHLYDTINSYNKEAPVVQIKDLNQQTNVVKPIEPMGTQKSNYFVDTTPKPLVNPFEAAKAKIQETTWAGDLQKVMMEIGADDNIGQSKKILLQQYAREHARNFND